MKLTFSNKEDFTVYSHIFTELLFTPSTFKQVMGAIIPLLLNAYVHFEFTYTNTTNSEVVFNDEALTIEVK